MAYTFKHGDRPLDEFTIQRAVGRGGFGEVYYAVSDGGREVALKYLKENPHVELRGVSNCINLKSPHLVSIFDVKKSNEGEYFIIMEYCSGPSLRDLLIAEPKGFSPEKAVFFAREIAKGLAYLHERGIVHRDLKPGNIFFDDGYVKIGDYGLSKFISVSRHSAQTSSVGTVHYMAPEIGSGSYSKGVDIYALGVMLYEMLCGKVPFEGSTMAEVLMKHLTTRPELDELPHGFSRIIRKALEKDPKDRYQTVEEMVDDLLSGEDIQKSLAGFRPESLSGAVRHHAADRMDSPMPSPNSPRGGFAHAAEVMKDEIRHQVRQALLPDKTARKFNRITRKLEKKMSKLGGRLPARVPSPPPELSPLGHVPIGKRIVLVGFLLVALSVGFGLLVGNSSHENYDERGAAAGLLAALMFVGVGLGRKAVVWFSVQDGPDWARHLVRAVCAAGPLAIGCAPLFDVGGGMPVWLGLISAAAFFKWDEMIEDGAGSEIKFGQIFGKALGALVVTAIIGAIFGFRRPERVMFISAGAAAIAAFVLQANAAWVTRPRRQAAEGSPDDRDPRGRSPARDMEATIDLRRTPPPPPPAVPLDSRSGLRLDAAPVAQAAARWAIARAFWGLVAFGLMGGAIVTFLIPLISTPTDPHDVLAAVIACCGFAAFTLFAVSKTGPMKRVGFWRETLRPLLISVSLLGIGGNTTLIAREWNHTRHSCQGDPELYMDNGEEFLHFDHEQISLGKGATRVEVSVPKPPAPPMRANMWAGGDVGGDGERCMGNPERIASVTGLVMSSLAFLVLTFFTGGAPRRSAPFLRSDHESASGPPQRSAGLTQHRGHMVLWMSIIPYFTGLFPLSIAAWVMGHNDLQEMRAGRMDPDGMGMTRAGVVLGAILSLLVLGGCVLGMVLFLATLL